MNDLEKITIISGGQTGADRAALDFAITHGLPHGGWCPRDRRAEDGPIPAKYLLRETASRHYSQRTKWNVRDSDCTVLFTMKTPLTGGTRLTYLLARELGKPALLLSRAGSDADANAYLLHSFIKRYSIRVLNIAGPRASQDPEIASFVEDVLVLALTS